MEELIFFAVIIFFSIIESIARSRKQKQKQGEGGGEPLPKLPDPSEWARQLPDLGTSAPELPTYDEEPSYDDRAARARPEPAPSAPTRSSDVLLPGDLLQELERLAGRAQERKGARTLELPKESPPLPSAEPTTRREPRTVVRRTPPPVPTARRTAGAPARPMGQHAVHRSHAGYGTDPSSRAPSLQDGLDPLAERRSADARAVHAQLRSADAGQLRQAIVLQEVLGPPLALRE